MAKIPEHVQGLLTFLRLGGEKANEDLALQYFRKAFGSDFTRQEDASHADGYCPQHFVLELKSREGDWLAALIQGLAYQRKLDFNLVIVAAPSVLRVWRVSDLDEDFRDDVLRASGAAHNVGTRLAKTYKRRAASLLKQAGWTLRGELLTGLFAANDDAAASEIRAFEAFVKAQRKVRRKITISNFPTMLQEMSAFFEEKLGAIRAFYGIVHCWNEESILELSQRDPTHATIAGELITGIVPGRGVSLKAFVEDRFVDVGAGESIDDFFSKFDRALDAVDKDFRRRNGIFFTDRSLSRFALWFARTKLGQVGKNHIVIDPACGSGNLVTSWRSPLELRHKVVSEIEPLLLFAVEQRMRGDVWHKDRYTVVPKVREGRGLNFLDCTAEDYLAELTKYLKEKRLEANKPLAILCNPPYRSDDDQSASAISYKVHPSIIETTGGNASADRYLCFLAQMKHLCRAAKESGLPGNSVLLLFTQTSWLTTRPAVQQLRREMLGAFEDLGGILVNGKEFFDVQNKFPIAFTVWRYAEGAAAVELDPARPVELLDLTHIRREALEAIDWSDEKATDRACEKILGSGTVQALGIQRPAFNASWAGTKRQSVFKGAKRGQSAGTAPRGLPRGDKRVWGQIPGVPKGRDIAFLMDRTPCRIDYRDDERNRPWLHLDSRFLKVATARCFSGIVDRGYCAKDRKTAEKLFHWFALCKTFAKHPAPLWANMSELWLPEEVSSELLRVSAAITLAHNECMEVYFPPNNPIAGAPESWSPNPMNPLDQTSFWHTEFGSDYDGRKSTDLAGTVACTARDIHQAWGRIAGRNDVVVSYARNYFVGPGRLRRDAGLIQIRDYAVELDESNLLKLFASFDRHRDKLVAAFHEALVAKTGANYFGRPTAPATVFKATSKFEKVLERRLATTCLILEELRSDPNLGRTKLAKALYVLDTREDLRLEAQYRREAAGPLDARLVYHKTVGIDAFGTSRGIFSIESSSGEDGVRYVPKRTAPWVNRAVEIFGEAKVNSMRRLLRLFSRMTTTQSEIVATLFAVWNDRLLRDKQSDDESLIKDVRENWHPKKKRFSAKRLQIALDWMRKNQLTPKGTGTATLQVRR